MALKFSLTVLGSSSALPTSLRYPSAHVLNVHERLFLIDCGEGTQLQLRKYHFNFSKINHIFISHLHGDHVYGIFGLISTLGLLGRTQPLHIYSHPNLKKIILQNLAFFEQNLPYRIEFHTINTGKTEVIYSDNKISITAFPLKHRIETVGFLFKEIKRPLNIKREMIDFYQIPVKKIQSIKDGEDFETSEGQIVANSRLTEKAIKQRSFAYCSDTAYFPEIVNIIKEVDLLYHEATFSESDKELAKKTGHSTARQAAEIAKQAKVNQLILGHFSSRYKNAFQHIAEAREVFEKSYEARDGFEFSVNETRLT